MGIKTVYIATLSFYGAEVTDPLKALIQGTFGVDTQDLDMDVNLSAAYSSHRNQYSADKVMGQLTALAPERGKTLALLDVDLFVPIFTFIFGEAQLNGRVAMVSTWRLRPELHTGVHDHRLFMDRLFKEALHELGHTFGLKHCYTPGCVMNFSPTVEHVDEKTFRFCRHCQSGLRWQ